MIEKNSKNKGSRSGSVRHDALQYIPSTIVPAFLGVLGAAIFTRVFAPNEYGQVVLVNSVIGPLASVVWEMFGQPTARYYAELQADGAVTAYANVISRIVKWTIFVVIGLIVMIVTVIWMVDPALRSWLFLLVGASVGLGVQSVGSLLLPLLPLQRDFSGYRNYAVGLSLLALLVPLSLVWAFGANIVWMIWGAALAGAMMLVPLVRRTRSFSPLSLFNVHYGTVERSLFRKFIRYGSPMAVWFFAASMIQTSDRYIIGAYIGTAAVAIYGSSYNLAAQAIGMITGPVVTAVWPTIMTTWANTRDRDQIRRIMSQATDLYFLIGIGLIGGSVVVGKDVVGILLGTKYFAGYVVLPPIMGGAVLWGSSMLGHKSMEIMERNDLMVWNVLFATALNVGLNILLVPRFGWKIAAYSTLVSYLAYTVGTWVIAKRFIAWDIKFFRLGAYVAFAVIGDLGARVINHGHSFVLSLVTSGVTFSVIYFGLGFGLREATAIREIFLLSYRRFRVR